MNHTPRLIPFPRRLAAGRQLNEKKDAREFSCGQTSRIPRENPITTNRQSTKHDEWQSNQRNIDETE